MYYNLGNDIKILKLYVVPSVAQTMILGVDFCKQCRLSVDFDSDSFELGIVKESKLESLDVPLGDMTSMNKDINDRSDLTPDQLEALDVVVNSLR